MVLKTLERAKADGDRIHAVVHGIGVSSDGRGKSLWAPRKEGQYTAIRRAYSENVTPASVQMVEAHATSTQVGDATEMEALSQFFAENCVQGQRIPVGSVKSKHRTYAGNGRSSWTCESGTFDSACDDPAIDQCEEPQSFDSMVRDSALRSSSMRSVAVDGCPCTRRAAVKCVRYWWFKCSCGRRRVSRPGGEELASSRCRYSLRGKRARTDRCDWARRGTSRAANVVELQSLLKAGRLADWFA